MGWAAVRSVGYGDFGAVGSRRAPSRSPSARRTEGASRTDTSDQVGVDRGVDMRGSLWTIFGVIGIIAVVLWALGRF
jgi:hypothetical protein